MVRTRHGARQSVPTVCAHCMLLMHTDATFTQGVFFVFLFTACFRYRVVLKCQLAGLKDRILKGCLNPTPKLLEPGTHSQELETIFFTKNEQN